MVAPGDVSNSCEKAMVWTSFVICLQFRRRRRLSVQNSKICVACTNRPTLQSIPHCSPDKHHQGLWVWVIMHCHALGARARKAATQTGGRRRAMHSLAA